MNKKQFIEELRKNLKFLKKEDREEILGDYEEHFIFGKEKKRTEAEIASSLGKPKEISKEIKQELNQESFNLGGMLNDTFFVMFSHLSDSLKIILHSVQEFFKTDFKDFIERKKESVKVKKKEFVKKIEEKQEEQKAKSKGNFIKKFILTFFNIFIGIWIMISIYITVGSLFVFSIAISVSGLATLVTSIVGIFYALPYVADNFLMPGIFAGISILVGGILLSIGSWQLGRVFSKLIKKYMKFNKKIMKGEVK